MKEAVLEIRERCACAGSSAALEELFAQYRPLVASICRRYLHAESDVDDAVQETFVKLLRHYGQVQTNLPAWLGAVAASTSIDMVRRIARKRLGRVAMEPDVLTHEASDDQWLMLEVVRSRLDDALRLVDEPTRKLIADRFFRGLALRDLAASAAVDVSTISRRVKDAVAELRQAFGDLGVELDGQVTLSDQLHELGELTGILAGDAALRLAPYWPAGPMVGAQAGAPPRAGAGAAPGAGSAGRAGVGRRIRVGALISYASTQVAIGRVPGFRFPTERGPIELEALSDPAFDRVSLVEPGTIDMPGIERAMRGLDLTGGMIDATDLEGLRTLDVIYLGYCVALPRRVIAAICQAVRGGVGLCCELIPGSSSPGFNDPLVREILLADGPILFWHHPRDCLDLVTGRWQETHPAFPGLVAGDTSPIGGCGPYYRPKSDARVLMIKEPAIAPNVGPDGRHLPEAQRPPAMNLPAVVVGTLGQGRVININFQHPMRGGSIGRHPHVRGDFLGNIFRYLAGAAPAGPPEVEPGPRPAR